MKKYVVLVIAAMLLVSSNVAYAGQFFGSPETTTTAGKVSVTAGYFYSEDNIKPDDKVSLGSSDIKVNWKTAQIKQNQVYIQGNYGFIDGGEVYVRAGLADMKSKNAFLFNSEFSDNLRPFGALGFKFVNHIDSTWGVGAYFQGTIYSSYKDEITESVDVPLPDGTIITNVPVKQKINAGNPSWEVDIGAALQAKVGRAIFYVGPEVYWLRLPKVEETISIGDPRVVSSPFTLTNSTSYKEKQNLGAFAGIGIPLGMGFRVDVEGQIKSRVSGGGALTYSF